MDARRSAVGRAVRGRRAGALAPFEDVLARHGAAVWRFSVSQVGRERAEDLFQETMLAALAAYPSLRDPAAVRPWLLRIAARKALDAFRAGARAPVALADPAGGAGGGGTRDPEPRDEDLWGRVRALPEKQRRAVALRFLLDLAYAEVGAAMRTTPEAARRNVFEALAALRAGELTAGPPRPPRGGPDDDGSDDEPARRAS